MAILDSFAKPDDWYVFSKSLLREHELLLGLYMNGTDDFVLFSDLAVYRVKGEKVRIIEYKDIREVDLPKDPEQRALYVHMRAGDTFLLPIVNETDEYPDFVSVRNFLVSLIYY
ncbi:MAG TPA: hypothetical protein PKZ32_09340, partial [Candidatus Melainabacteria bacterium]|nr:hypothetical protein [Candidatus Melainabacteria bacterium]